MNKRRVVIAGGGTAGWMAAAAVSQLMGDTVDVTLVESDAIPAVGVGEATIPTLHVLHRLLGINEREFMAETDATLKLGIAFENWFKPGHEYLHSFGLIGHETWACGFHHFWLKARSQGWGADLANYIPEYLAALEGRYALPQPGEHYAYHLDAGLYAKFLRKIAEENHTVRIEGVIDKVNIDPDTGYISSLRLESGQQIGGELFIDCSGFRGLLIEGALHSGFEDWGHHLLCDRAVAVQTESLEPPLPYTRSIARDCGWQWRIPLQSRTGNGFVFCSQYMSDDEAIDVLLKNIRGKPINAPRVIRYRTGVRRAQWNKNCIAVGLSGGFVEPLESTGIHLFQRAIIRLLQFFPNGKTIPQSDIDEFNQASYHEMERIRDFIVLHYHQTERDDTPFWRHCRAMSVPDTLRHRINTFSQSGRVKTWQDEVFAESSWVMVMLGQGIVPQRYHPIVDRLTNNDLKAFVDHVETQTRKKVESWPNHFEFIRRYCKSAL